MGEEQGDKKEDIKKLWSERKKYQYHQGTQQQNSATRLAKKVDAYTFFRVSIIRIKSECKLQSKTKIEMTVIKCTRQTNGGTNVEKIGREKGKTKS